MIVGQLLLYFMQLRNYMGRRVWIHPLVIVTKPADNMHIVSD